MRLRLRGLLPKPCSRTAGGDVGGEMPSDDCSGAHTEASVISEVNRGVKGRTRLRPLAATYDERTRRRPGAYVPHGWSLRVSNPNLTVCGVRSTVCEQRFIGFSTRRGACGFAWREAMCTT